MSDLLEQDDVVSDLMRPKASRERGPILVIAACIVHRNTILLARRNQPELPEIHGRWEFPGGKMRLGETPTQAIRREIEEELGLDVNVVRLLPHVQSNVYHRPDDSIGHFVILCFECVLAPRANSPSLDLSAVLEFQWVERSHARILPTLPGTKEFVECLDRMDTKAEYLNSFSVILERSREKMKASRWHFVGTPDLFGDYTVVGRRVNLETKSTNITLMNERTSVEAQRRVAQRVRSLARYGYTVVESSSPMVYPPLTGGI